MKNLQGYFDTLLEDGYIVKDDIERGYLNVIPLWMFGLKSGFPPFFCLRMLILFIFPPILGVFEFLHGGFDSFSPNFGSFLIINLRYLHYQEPCSIAFLSNST